MSYPLDFTRTCISLILPWPSLSVPIHQSCEVNALSPRSHSSFHGSASPGCFDTKFPTTLTRHVIRTKTPTSTRAYIISSTPSISSASSIRYQLPSPSPKIDSKGQMSMDSPNQHPLHVHLGFNLYADGKQKNPTKAELERIMAVFPTCYAATLMNPLLILHYETLPPRPWPLTIAGLPVYLTTELQLSPLPLGLPAGGSPLEIDATVCLWKTPTVDAMMKIFRGFDAKKLSIQAIRWFGVRFLVDVEGEPPENWRSVYPRRINKLHVSYIFGGKAETPRPLRVKLPTDAEPDDANYTNILRPGVILSSGTGPDGFELRSTSGVCVEPPSGTKYVTCASHGFPQGLEDVYHPNAGRSIVGRVSKRFCDSDVSLILPSHGFQYSQEPFSSAEYPSSPFSALKHPFELCIGDTLHMDTQFNGHCEGIVVAVRMMRLPSNEPAAPYRYVVGTFGYIGNGSAQPLDGCCGGVVWTDKFEPIGQFCYLDKEDSTAYITSFEHLIDLGYKLSNIEEDACRILAKE